MYAIRSYYVPQAENTLLKPRILVVGVGGAGGNAVNNMIQSELEGVEFLVTNTDAQALSTSRASRCIQIGTAVTQGLGAGARPRITSYNVCYTKLLRVALGDRPGGFHSAG